MRGVSWTVWLEGSRGNESTLHRLKASLRKVVHKVHRKIFLWACRMVGSSRLRVWKLLFFQSFLVKTLHNPAVGPLGEEMNVHMKAKAQCPDAFEIYTPSAPLLLSMSFEFYILRPWLNLPEQPREKKIHNSLVCLGFEALPKGWISMPCPWLRRKVWGQKKD